MTSNTQPEPDQIEVRDRHITRTDADPVLAAVVAEIKAAHLTPTQRSAVLSSVPAMRKATSGGTGVTGAGIALVAADKATDPTVAQTLRKIAPHLITGETHR